MDEAAIRKAAGLLVEARRTGVPLGQLPEGCHPASVAEAHAIQDAAVALLGEPVAGWKVALAGDGSVMRGVILQSRVWESPARVPAALVPLLGVEAEIAFRFERDLPPRPEAYAREAVEAAVTAIVAIEIVASRFQSYRDTPLLDRAADFVSNGGFVRGTLQPRWREHELSSLEVTLAIDGETIVSRQGGHPAVDPLLPAIALVNELRRGPGVRSGQLVTTGTYSGLNFAKPGQSVAASFADFGTAEVRFDA